MAIHGARHTYIHTYIHTYELVGRVTVAIQIATDTRRACRLIVVSTPEERRDYVSRDRIPIG
jgi:hypothetical protein